MIGGGAAAWALYTKVRSMADARDVSDDEDIYDGESEDPILEARKLRARQYYDKVLKKIITSWKEIKGSIVDLGTKVVISAKRLSGKLFSAEGKAVVLRGLNAVKSAGLKLFNWLDPLNRLKGMGQGIANRITQMDVYRVGEDSPVLTRKGFENGKYFKRLNGSVVPVKGWRDIDGPVYDENGDVIITQAEYEDGLITSGGMKIESLKRMTGVMGGYEIAGWDEATFDSAIDIPADAFSVTLFDPVYDHLPSTVAAGKPFQAYYGKELYRDWETDRKSVV